MRDEHEHTRTAARLRAVIDDTPEMRIPAVRARDGQPGRATRVHAPVPLDVDLIDMLGAHTEEVHTYARAHTDGPMRARPAVDADVYEWARQAVPDPDGGQPELDAIAWRHAADISLHLGDQRPVREQPCPACGCWGLTWHPDSRQVVCLNQRCLTKGGAPVTFTLQQMAVHAVRRAARARTGT